MEQLQGREDARRDFEWTARLRSPFARRQLLTLNLYAALSTACWPTRTNKAAGSTSVERYTRHRQQ